MIRDGEKGKEDCQLQVVYEAGGKPNFFDRLRHLWLRGCSAVRRRLGEGADSLPPSGPGVGLEGGLINDNPQETSDGKEIFRDGETVRIKTFEEIQETLDARGRCEGLQFMTGMKKYCGREARILKKARMIFDEQSWRMVKLRNTYILENITCEGRDVFDGEGCDRTCYFFWKGRWLRKS
jgi:hypothetical protein